MRTGSIKHVGSDYNYMAYGRFNKQGQSLILINNNDYPIYKEISVWEIGTLKTGKMKVLLQSYEDGYTLEGPEYEMSAGKIRIELPKTSATILKYVRED